MADYLYVCQFSNGLIKVGRSVDPFARISAHEERVACMGVLLANHQTVACVSPSGPAESALIARCTEAASKRHLEEWFEGLDFSDVCRWARDAVEMNLDFPVADSRWRTMLLDLKRIGLTQMQIAAHCGCDQSTISALSNGRAEEPRHSLGERIISLHKVKAAHPHPPSVAPP